MYIFGFKAFYKNLENRYGEKYEIEKLYTNDGLIEWNKNGFHFCEHLEDCFRYYDAFNKNVEISYVLGFGDIITYDDEYYGYFDMHASSKMIILKVLSPEEVSNYMSNKYLENSYKISTYPYSDKEIKKLLKNNYINSHNIESYLLNINKQRKEDRTLVRNRII